MNRKTVNLFSLRQSSQDEIKFTEKISSVHVRGVGCDTILEPVPRFNQAPCEKLLEGSNNSSIVLGRDRPAGKLSGYGGAGHTQCGSIDIVTGRHSATVISQIGGEEVYADPDFEKDAARIYISQKTDIDKNFGILTGQIGVGESVGLSGIGIKADAVRVIGREGIKLVTGIDLNNSVGAPIAQVTGIDLIAGNMPEYLQPIPKGYNVRDAFEKLVGHVDKLSGIVDSFLTIQAQYNDILASHFHISPFFGIPDPPSSAALQGGIKASINLLSDVKMSLMNFKINLVNYRMSYLEQFGEKYINSRWNNTN